MLQAYIDDSGRGQQPAFVMSGYLATVPQWEQFSRAWQAELDIRPSVEYFKMKEAASGTGQFAGHKRELIAHRVMKLVAVTKAHVLLGFTLAIPYRAFNRIMLPFFETLIRQEPGHPLKDVFRNPYFHAFNVIAINLIHDQWQRNNVEPIDFIFDEQGKEGVSVRQFWDVLRATVPVDAVRNMLINEPVFRNDKDTLPLQAADLTAWQVRRYIHQLSKRRVITERPVLDGVLTELNSIPHRDFLFGEQRCRQYVRNYPLILARLNEGKPVDVTWMQENRTYEL